MAEAEAYRALDPPVGRPRLWCDEPPFDSTKSVANQLHLSGWAFSPQGIGGIHVEVAGRQFAAHYGTYRPDVPQAFRGEGIREQTGWLLRLETSCWQPREYEATITARDHDGRETSVRRVVEVHPQAAYRSWREHRRLSLPGPAAARRFLDDRKFAAPQFQVCLLCSGATPEQLERTNRSLGDQLYPNWSLLLVGRGPVLEDSDVPRLATDDKLSAADHFAAGLRRFLESSADFASFVRAGDLVEPHGLLALAQEVVGPDAPQLLYADEDILIADGERVQPYFKPGWSPELLLSTDYVGPFVSAGREAVSMALEADPEPIGSPYELMLRLVDAELRVKRVPDVLYSRDEQSVPSEEEEEASVGRLLQDVGRRRGKRAQVTPLKIPGMRQVAWELEGKPRVSIVVATALAGNSLLRCLESIRDRTSYSNFEVVVVAHNPGASPPERDLPGLDWRLLAYEGSFNYSAINNFGAASSTGDYLLFVNVDTEVESRDWIERLLEQSEQPGIAAVGGKLLYPDGILRLAGMLLVDGPPGARPIGSGFPGDEPGYRGLFAVTRNTSSVGGECMLIAREAFDSLKGFDEAFAVELGDVDLCLRLQRAGRRVVWTPRAVLKHHERTSLGEGVYSSDYSRFRQRWGSVLKTGDPYYNPNLSTESDEYEIGYPGPAAGAGSSDDGEEQRPSPERFVPETMEGIIKAEHEARYRWAASVVRDKEVLDAGCGVGYGAQILSEAGAARVVGVDLSTEAVADAAFRAGHLAQFLVADLQSLPLGSASFDVVVCFEAIEHVEHGDAVLDELKRVLRPSGVVLLSSPNRAVYLPGNPYHVHEYTPAELEEALAKRFANVALYRQHPWVTSLVTDDAGFAARSAATEIDGSLRKVAGAKPGDEVYTLAAASDGPLPDLGTSAVMTDAFEVKAWYERVRALEKELSRLRERVSGLRGERRMLQQQLAKQGEAIHALHASLSWRLTRPLRSAKALASRRIGSRRTSSGER